MDKVILKFIWKAKGARIVKTILKKYKVGKKSLFNIKAYYVDIIIKTSWYRWNILEDPDIDMHKYT